MYCQNCGKEIEAGSRFCGHCGANLTTQNIQRSSQNHTAGQKSSNSSKRKMKMPFVVILLVAIAIFFIWTFIGEKKTDSVPEQQMIEDIYAKNRDLRETNLEITEYEVTSQEQDEELGTYTAWIIYAAENSEAVYHGETMLYYQLSEDVWYLADWERGINYYTAKFDCDPSVPQTYLQGQYPQNGVSIFMVEQVSSADNECHFVYQVTGQENPVCSWTDGWEIDCTYDLWDGWQVVDANGEKIGEVWDICGTYICENENISARIDLSSFEMDVANNMFAATLSYSLTSYMDNGDLWGGPAMQQNTTYYSNEPELVECSLGYDNEYVVIKIGNYVDLYICGRYVSWDPIGEGLGLWIKVLGNYSNTYGEYWLYKQ